MVGKEKKRRQHYVWKHYLGAWASGSQVWCQRQGRRFRTSTDNVANRQDFYRLKEMRDRDLAIVKLLVIDRVAPNLQPLIRGWIPYFRDLHRLMRLYESLGRKDAEVEAALDVAINNLEEELHARIEGKGVPILAALRARDASILDGQGHNIDFFWYLAVQYFRTAGMARAVTQALSEVPDFNADAAWGLMRTCFATTTGYSFFSGRGNLRMTFLEAQVGAEFITGDQPLINVRAKNLPAGTAPTEVELYYPLGPSLALLMDFQHPRAVRDQVQLTLDEVSGYNQLMFQSSTEQVYAASEDALARAAGDSPANAV